MLQQFQAGDIACTDNDVTGDYFVNYTAIPRPGWQFVSWEGPCGHLSEGINCRLDAPEDRVTFWDDNFSDIPTVPTTAVFEPISADGDGPFYMINLIVYSDNAEYADGRQTNMTGKEADAMYRSLVSPILSEIGARPVCVADVAQNLIDEDMAEWDHVEIVQYPSYAKFIAMTLRQDFRDATSHINPGFSLRSHRESDLVYTSPRSMS